jgi:hypothetical protein
LIHARFHEVILPNFGHLIPHMRPAEVVLAIEEAAGMVDGSPRPIDAAALPKQ